jgi:TRAP-type C4-dicarboxylate transport system substrate-binding protein
MQDDHIVKGYKGVMDLDLSLIDPKFHKEVIAQHMKDIDEYKREQLERPEKLRYDTAIMHAHNIIELDRRAAEQLRKDAIHLQNQKDKQKEDTIKRIEELKKIYNK